MKLSEAKLKAEQTLCYFKPYVNKMEVVGSVRRECEECNDLDFVLIPNEHFKIVLELLKPYIKKQGDKIIIYEIDGTQYDLYLCNEKNYSVIKLIRTGSKFHNQKLCSLAIKNGLSLKAGGDGLVDHSGTTISDTEEGILINLLGHFVEPKDRK